MHFNRHIWTYIITYKLLGLTVLYINIKRIKMHDKLILKNVTEKLKTFIFSQMSSWVSLKMQHTRYHFKAFHLGSGGKGGAPLSLIPGPGKQIHIYVN